MLPRRWLALAAAGTLSIAVFLPSCGVKYLAVSGYYQAELLASRVDNDEVLARGVLTPAEAERLRQVPAIKSFGESLGLRRGTSYESLALGWKRQVWNVSACHPLRFEPETWWFPIVGRIHYLGFFTENEAQSWRVRMESKGLDVYVRQAGAYSTLGWFADPVLPSMLGWSEGDLAETILHEMTHASLWIPGSASFNESFAQAVGEEGARQYLVATHGPEADPSAEKARARADSSAFRQVLAGLYADLDRVYSDPTLGDEAKLARKRELFASLHARILESPIERKPRYLQVADTQTWNNARLVQYRTYDARPDLFRRLMEREGRDVRRFVAAVERITRGKRDPFAAVEADVGAPVGVQIP
jgi:predicted aminopeptidase